MLTGKTILIVENSSSCLDLYNELLNITEAVLLFARNGQEAVKKSLEINRIDLVIMEFILPDISGIEIIKRIRRMNSQLPIIVASASVYKQHKISCMEAGSTVFIEKPVNTNLLLEEIERLTLKN